MLRYAFTAAPAAKVAARTAPALPHDFLGKQPWRSPYAWLLLLVVAVLSLAGLFSWYAFFRPVTVSTAPVETNVRVQVFGLGVIGARVQSNIGFKVSGVLAALNADQSDRVYAGQVLARLDARDVEAQVAVMKAGVAQAQANIEKAKADVVSATATLTNAKAISARRTELASKGFASQEEAQTNEAAQRVAAASLAAAQSAVAVAEAALRSAEAQEASQEATLTYYTLRAPYDAWIVSRNLELGSMPNPGQSVFTVVAAHTVWAVAYVDERLAGRLSVGQPAEIILRSDRNVRIPGHVERIEIQSDPVNEERIVDVAFDQIPDNIHLAEQAEVVISAGVLPRAIVLQPSAVSNVRHGQGTVWTVENDQLERREVQLGPELLDGRIPILSDLPAGAIVVASPVSGLRIGRAARIAQGQYP